MCDVHLRSQSISSALCSCFVLPLPRLCQVGCLFPAACTSDAVVSIFDSQRREDGDLLKDEWTRKVESGMNGWIQGFWWIKQKTSDRPTLALVAGGRSQISWWNAWSPRIVHQTTCGSSPELSSQLRWCLTKCWPPMWLISNSEREKDASRLRTKSFAQGERACNSSWIHHWVGSQTMVCRTNRQSGIWKSHKP